MDEADARASKFHALASRLDEATLRLWAATEARSRGRGGVSAVAKACGISRTTIYAGLSELGRATPAQSSQIVSQRRVRARGGGRKKWAVKDALWLRDWDAWVEPATRGDPGSALRGTCKSTTRLAEEWGRLGHTVRQRSDCDLLGQLHYSLQSTRTIREGSQNPDRDAPFSHSAGTVAEFQAAGDPVIAVDTKKKALIGDFKNGGREGQPKGRPEEVRVHDFIDPPLGKVAPYGVYDVSADPG